MLFPYSFISKDVCLRNHSKHIEEKDFMYFCISFESRDGRRELRSSLFLEFLQWSGYKRPREACASLHHGSLIEASSPVNQWAWDIFFLSHVHKDWRYFSIQISLIPKKNLWILLALMWICPPLHFSGFTRMVAKYDFSDHAKKKKFRSPILSEILILKFFFSLI